MSLFFHWPDNGVGSALPGSGWKVSLNWQVLKCNHIMNTANRLFFIQGGFGHMVKLPYSKLRTSWFSCTVKASIWTGTL